MNRSGGGGSVIDNCGDRNVVKEDCVDFNSVVGVRGEVGDLGGVVSWEFEGIVVNFSRSSLEEI